MRDLLLAVLFLVALAGGGVHALLHSLRVTQPSLKCARTPFNTPSSRFMSDSKLSDEEKVKLDSRYNKLIGTFIKCTFSGFGDVEGMSCNIELQKDFAVKFSGGLDTPKPGFWRALKLDNGNEVVEATQPVFAEYMFYFDLWEPNLVWKGTLDLENMKVTDGEVFANKKRFGLIPYQDSIATFSGDILPIADKAKMRAMPTFAAQRFVPPNDFEDPMDMKRYPELFEPSYVEWWFEAEDALARGLPAPPRPQTFFSPPEMSSKGAYMEEESARRSDDLTAVREMGKKSGKGNKGSKGMSVKKTTE
jgi:hypothetical protein